MNIQDYIDQFIFAREDHTGTWMDELRAELVKEHFGTVLDVCAPLFAHDPSFWPKRLGWVLTSVANRPERV